MSTLRPIAGVSLLGLLLFLGLPVPASAAAAPVPVISVSAPSPGTAPFADSVSWQGFTRYWKGFVKNADRVILVVGLVAVTALFIITRGRWLK